MYMITLEMESKKEKRKKDIHLRQMYMCMVLQCSYRRLTKYPKLNNPLQLYTYYNMKYTCIECLIYTMNA